VNTTLSLGTFCQMLFLGACSAAALAADDKAADRPPAQETSAAATRTVAGRIVDADGKPVDGARVWWVVRQRFKAAGRTDAAGRFRLTTPTAWMPPDLKRQVDVVWALGPNNDVAVGLACDGLVTEGKSRDWELRLNRAEVVRVSVVDPDGRPVAGATVEPANFRNARGFDLLPEPITTALRATTDAAGHARMHIGFRDFFNVFVTSERFGVQDVRLDPRDSEPERTIRLNDVGRIEGRLIAKEPKDVRGVPIRIQSVRGTTEGWATVVTDERGNFVVPQLAWGTIHVRGGSGDGSSPLRPRLPNHFLLRAGETAHLEIPVERLVTVRGSVQTEDTHAPVAGANVTVGFGNGMQGSQAVTDAKGRFEVRVLPGSVDSPTITELPESVESDYEQVGEPWDKKTKVPADDQPFEMPPVVLVRRITLRGKVIDHDGQPLAKATVCGDVGNRRYGFGKTDAKGEFTMKVPRAISPQRYEVFAPPDDRSFEVTVVRDSPLLLKAIDWSKRAKPIPPN